MTRVTDAGTNRAVDAACLGSVGMFIVSEDEAVGGLKEGVTLGRGFGGLSRRGSWGWGKR